MFIRKLEKDEFKLIENVDYYFESNKYFSIDKKVDSEGINFSLTLNDFDNTFKQNLYLDLNAEYLKEIHINVIEENEEVVGFIQMGYEEVNKMAVIMNIWVKDDKRRDGIAKKLMKSSKGYARFVHAKGVYMEVSSKNYPAVKFFLKNGFEITGINEMLHNDEIIIGFSSLFE